MAVVGESHHFEQLHVQRRFRQRRRPRLRIVQQGKRALARSRRHRPRLHHILIADEVQILPAQVGAAFFVNDRFSGLDLLGGPDLVGSLLPKIVRSYAIDALEDEGSDGGLSPIDDVVKTSASESEGRAAVLEVIERVGRLAASRTKAAGLGEDLRLRDDSLIGAALVSSGAVVHLAVWSAAYR